MLKYDLYELKARIYPAIISMIIPLIIFNHFFIGDKLSALVNHEIKVKILSNITISVVLLYYLSQFGRVIGKGLFEKMFFSDELRMPTTDLLMFSNQTYSHSHKAKIREKVLRDFGVALPTQKEEEQDEFDSRTRIVEVMALIRKKLTGNEFLLQHNTEYGAIRNLIGGGVIGLIFSTINIAFFTYIDPNTLAVYLSLITGVVYLVLILFSKILIQFYGRRYAKILFQEYLVD